MRTPSSPQVMKRLLSVSSVLLVVGILLFAAVGIVYAGALPVWQQCNDGQPPTGVCNWTGGALNGSQTTYVEGMATPQRGIWTGLTSANHSIGWNMEWTKAGYHAYDFAVSWAQAQTLAQTLGGFTLNMNRCEQLTGADLTACNNAGAYHITVPVPTMNYASSRCGPPNFPTGGPCNANTILPAWNTAYGQAYIDVYSDQPINATLGVTPPAGADTGDIDFGYTLYYTPTGASAPSIINLTFAAHVAVGDSPGDPAAPGINWGFGYGASAISGAPYHVREPAIDGVKVSSQDNQLSLNGSYGQPIAVTRLSSGTASLSTGSWVSDTLMLTAQGASPTTITGTVKFFACFEPNVTSLANAAICVNPHNPDPNPNSYPTVTVYSQIGTDINLTAANNNVVSSGNYFLGKAGVYCFSAQYISHIYPWQSTQSFQKDYTGTPKTNGGPECVVVTGATAVTLSSFEGQSNSAIPIPDGVLIPGILGAAGVIVLAGLLGLRWRRS